MCDVIGVCSVPHGRCSAVARRTKVRSVMKFSAGFGITSFFLLKAKAANGRDLSAYAVKTIRAWLKAGSKYIVNFEIEEPPVMDCNVLLGQWKDSPWSCVSETSWRRLTRSR